MQEWVDVGRMGCSFHAAHTFLISTIIIHSDLVILHLVIEVYMYLIRLYWDAFDHLAHHYYKLY